MTALLERRYRRLLRWYPPEHRQVHGEEMIGVLVAGQRPGQDRPSPAQALDLMAGGLRIRLRPGRAFSDQDGWRAALAIFSLTAPLLAVGALALSIWADHYLAHQPGLTIALAWFILYGQAPVAVLVLLRLRRAAAVAAAGQVLAVAALPFLAGYGPQYRPATAILQSCWLAAPSLAELAALLASPGPRRAWSLLRPRHWLALGAATVPATVLMPTLSARFWDGDPVGVGVRILSLEFRSLIGAVAAAALVLLLAGLWLSSAAGHRLAVLYAALTYPYLVWTVLRISGASLSQPAGVLAAAPMAVIGGTIALLVVRSRGTSGA
jgi:hypothetical protein